MKYIAPSICLVLSAIATTAGSSLACAAGAAGLPIAAVAFAASSGLGFLGVVGFADVLSRRIELERAIADAVPGLPLARVRR